VIFKGSGFWETDYNRGGDYAKKQKADVAPAAAKSTESADKPTKPTKPLTSPTGGAGAAAGDIAPKAKAQAKPLAIAKAGGAS
jgi:hypothetical protein